MFLYSVLIVSLLITSTFSTPLVPLPSFSLNNTSVQGLMIPSLGVGTGAYDYCPNVGYGGYPECMDANAGCGQYTIRTVVSWLQLGGRRIDGANSYGNTAAVGQAIKQSGIDRSEIFITEKVGPPPSVALGYHDTLIQVDQILRDLQTDYVDLLLIHEPVQSIPQSSDIFCRQGSPVYSEKACRLSTWRAMIDVFNAGKAKSIGVSNYNITHLQEIVDAGLPLPSVNQCPFNYYHSSVQQELRDYCAQHGILFHGYSALGAPDVFVYPIQNSGLSYIQLADPVVQKIAATHSASPAQVLINWEISLGMPVNVRSQNEDHMTENLNAYFFKLTQDEINTLSSGPQGTPSTGAQSFVPDANQPLPKPGRRNHANYQTRFNTYQY